MIRPRPRQFPTAAAITLAALVALAVAGGVAQRHRSPGGEPGGSASGATMAPTETVAVSPLGGVCAPPDGSASADVAPSRRLPASIRRPRGVGHDLGDPEHACRFWGLVGSGYPPDLIDDQLRSGSVNNLRRLGNSNPDGWGFVSYPAGTLGQLLHGPLVRRGRPAANDSHDADFDHAVDEMIGLSPTAAVGHVRAASSGHFGLPNPHPFVEEGLAFAHNGTLPVPTLVALLTAGNPGYLTEHPPEYVTSYIDSELYLYYLLQYRHAHPELSRAEALRDAAGALFGTVAPARLNFVMTSGDTLFALRCSGYDDYDPVRYYPDLNATSSVGGSAKTPASPFWAVASQPVGSDLYPWAPLPPRTLGVFVPGQEPQFLPVSAGPDPVFSIRWAAVTDTIDNDHDHYFSAFTVEFSPRVDQGMHEAFARVMAFYQDEEFIEFASTDTFQVIAGNTDTVRVSGLVKPPDRPGQIWDLAVLLYSPADPDHAVAMLASDIEPRLADIHVEGAVNDGGRGTGDPASPPTGSEGGADDGAAPDGGASPADRTSPGTVRIGVARPNPSDGGFVIPWQAPGGGLARPAAGTAPAAAPVGASIEIWDARGALVWREHTAAPSGGGELRWDGRNRAGERVAAGTYFCRIRAGSDTAERRLVVVR